MSSGMLDAVLNSKDELEGGLEPKAAEVVRENENILVDMNTATLKQGLDATGNPITPSYFSDDYAEMKNRMNPRPGFGTPDLFLEGDFQEGYFLKEIPGGWETDSRDEKRNMLVSKYSDAIFGNTEQDETEFNEEYILPELVEWIMSTLNEKL